MAGDIWLAYDVSKLRGQDLSISESCAHCVKVESYEALIQVLGYLKFNCDGPVYFRGQSRHYTSSLKNIYADLPIASAMRSKMMKYPEIRLRIYGYIQAACNWRDKSYFCNDTLIADIRAKDYSQDHLLGSDVPLYAFEPFLQHYGLATRWLDITDSLPYALFFSVAHYESLPKFMQDKISAYEGEMCDDNRYSGYLSPYMTNQVVSVKRYDSSNDLDRYVYLYAISPGKRSDDQPLEHAQGICRYSGGYVVDAREAIPSQYFRPHAQHGLLLKPDYNYESQRYSSDCKCLVFELERNKVIDWLGDGHIFKPASIYPSLSPQGKDLGSSPTDIGLYTINKNLHKIDLIIKNKAQKVKFKSSISYIDCAAIFKDIHNYIVEDI